MITGLRRVISNGAKSFWRSGAVTFATVLIMTVTMIIIGILMFLSALLTYTLDQVQSKVDVSVYFTTSADEGTILNLKDKLALMPQVAEVTYTSRDQALQQFRERHASDQLTLNALQELGTNPLGASLAIRAKDPTQYKGIVDFINSDRDLNSGGASLIDHINYEQNKNVIDRLTGAIKAIEQAGLVIVVIFAVASTIIMLATVRLAIYSSRDEIAVMRLVGASNAYIRGPFLVTGMLAGVIAATFALIIFIPVAWYMGQHLSAWLGGFNVFTYYLNHILLFAEVLFGSGIFLGAFASYVGIRRYLRV